MSIKIPMKYLRIDKRGRTKSTRNKKTGQMTGRVRTSGKDDGTTLLRLSESVDLNKNKRIDDNELGGTIIGRVPKNRKRRASLISRGYYVRD